MSMLSFKDGVLTPYLIPYVALRLMITFDVKLTLLMWIG